MQRFEGIHCAITVGEPAPGVVLVTIEGTDIGELGTAPFAALDPLVALDRRVELFIDAGTARGASIDVSSGWSRWLGSHRDRLRHVSMLTGSRYVQVTAAFVARFADLGERMRLYTDRATFEGALSNAVGNARSP